MRDIKHLQSVGALLRAAADGDQFAVSEPRTPRAEWRAMLPCHDPQEDALRGSSVAVLHSC